MEIIEITIDEFEDSIYDKYVILFPKEEQRDWKKVKRTYLNGNEKFYKICLANEIIGFLMLEKLDKHPYYLDYFAIFKEYQDKGYGKTALDVLIKDIIKDEGVIGEIESVKDSNPITKRRFKFYEKIGFKQFGSKYLLYKVLYDPIVYYNDLNKEKLDIIFFDYYNLNIGKEDLKKNCRIVK